MVELKVLTPRQLEKQVRFASARALTGSAFAVRDGLVKSLPQHFTIRSTWTARRLRVVKATRDNLTAKVGHLDQYMRDQVEGGSRLRGSVPTRKLRRSPSSPLYKSKWPRTLLNNKQRFIIINAQNAALKGGLSRHRGRREKLVFRQTGKRRKLTLLWIVLDSRQRIRKRWPFHKTGLKVFGQVYSGLFHAELKKALASAKPS